MRSYHGDHTLAVLWGTFVTDPDAEEWLPEVLRLITQLDAQTNRGSVVDHAPGVAREAGLNEPPASSLADLI
jgi:hypothetical protein